MRLPKYLRPRSIRQQLMAAYIVVLLLALGLATITFLVLFVWRDDAATEKGLRKQAEWVAEAIVFDKAGKPVTVDLDRNGTWMYTSIASDLKYAVLDGNGAMLFTSDLVWRSRIPAFAGPAKVSPVSPIIVQDIVLQMLTMPVKLNGEAYYIQVARSDRLSELVRKAVSFPVLKTAMWVSVVSLLLLYWVVYVTLRRSLRPLRHASEAAARIEPGNLSARLDTAGLPSEMTTLVEAFNNALNRIEQGYRVQQAFLAGAAHELKTPLALIRAQIELDGSANRTALLSDVDMMARQVHQLLHLAEVSEAHNYVIAPTNMVAVASEVIGYLGRLADRRQVSLRLLAPGGEAQIVAADRSASFVMLKNLVENAVRHSPSGGTVIVALAADQLYVEDTGHGIAEEDLPRLYVRFWRGPDRRDDGAGLGLAICHQIATTHGWTIEARNVSPGARFTVNFSNQSSSSKAAVILGKAS